MRYQAVIFDLDGVICHTDEFHYLAWKQIADRLQIPFNPAINHRMRGIDRMASLMFCWVRLAEIFRGRKKSGLQRKRTPCIGNC
jgi:beta-phosphoglucomutase-like phosphatase (HAD superfamily)